MPITCNNSLVTSVINECANLFTVGRCGPGTIQAIVLHEYDGVLSQLDAEHKQSTIEAERMCHTSFHFGVGEQGFVHQYVEIENTAWSFPPDWNTSPDCGVGDWLIAQGNPTIDPNCYTINIAVSTGQVGAGRRTEDRKDNNYSFQTIQSLIDLVCCLISENGVSITIDANTVWRHLNELSDFPGCKVVTSSGNAASYDDVLTCVQNCVDTTNTGIPSKAMAICDTIECLIPAGNPIESPESVDFIQTGAQSAENLLNSTNVLFELSGLPFGKSFLDGYQSADILIDQDNITNQFCVTFDQDQTNLRIAFGAFGTTQADRFIGFNILPTSVTGDLQLLGGAVTSTVPAGVGEIVWASIPAGTKLQWTFDNTNPVTQSQRVTMMYLQSDQIFGLIGAEAVPGVTQVLGSDCRTYTIPASMAGGDVTCTVLAGLPNSGNATSGVNFVGSDCQTYNLDVCELIQNAGIPTQAYVNGSRFLGLDNAGECALMPLTICTLIQQSGIIPTIPSDIGTLLVGQDSAGNCGFFNYDFCDLFSANPPSQSPAIVSGTFLMGVDGTGACSLFPANICDLLDATTVPTQVYVNGSRFFGINDVGDCALFPLTICSLIQESGTIPTIALDVGSVFIGLNNAGACGIISADICDLLSVSQPATLPADVGTLFLGVDSSGTCGMFAAPSSDFCTLANSVVAVGQFDRASSMQIIQQSGGASCLIDVDPQDSTQGMLTGIGAIQSGFNAELGVERFMESIIWNPGQNVPIIIQGGEHNGYIFDASGGNVNVPLLSPSLANPNHHVKVVLKRVDVNAGNTVTITSVDLIDGSPSVQIGTPGPISPSAGGALVLSWDESRGTWWIL